MFTKCVQCVNNDVFCNTKSLYIQNSMLNRSLNYCILLSNNTVNINNTETKCTVISNNMELVRMIVTNS